MNADLAQDFKALADDVGEVVKNFGKVAAGFALQHHRRHEELDGDQRDAVGEVDQGVAYREPEFLLFVELAEFSGNGFGDLVGNHFEGGGKCVSGANGARERIDGFGELLLKFLEAPGPHMRGIGVGDKKPEQTAGPAKQDGSPAAGAAAGDESDGPEYQGGYGTKHQEVSGSNIDVSLSQHFLQKRDSLRAAQKSVESRYPAEQFVAKKSDVRRGLFGWFLSRGEAIAENAGLGLALIIQRYGGEDPQGDHHKHQQGDEEQHPLDLHPGLEERGTQAATGGGEALGEMRRKAGGMEDAAHLAALVNAGAFKNKNILQRNHVSFHSNDFGNGEHFARTVGETRNLDHGVNSVGDLMANRALGNVQVGHGNHIFDASQGIAWRVGVYGGERTLMTGIHGLQHVEGFLAAHL